MPGSAANAVSIPLPPIRLRGISFRRSNGVAPSQASRRSLATYAWVQRAEQRSVLRPTG